MQQKLDSFKQNNHCISRLISPLLKQGALRQHLVNIQAVPPEAGYFDQKISIYKDAFDDFTDKMGADANIFVHPASFLASITLSDTVSEQDAKDYLFEKADELIQEHEQQIEEQETDEQDTDDTLEDL